MRRELPIIFSGPMVRALLAGKKTQTRRIIKPQPTRHMLVGNEMWGHEQLAGHFATHVFGNCFLKLVGPKNPVGTRLYVKETHWMPPPVTEKMWREGADTWPEVAYAIDTDGAWETEMGWRKRPSIHLPKAMSRIWLTVTDVRVQRLQEISEDDAKTEGAFGYLSEWGWKRDPSDLSKKWTAREEFMALWENIHGNSTWESNPWVWAYTFEVNAANK